MWGGRIEIKTGEASHSLSSGVSVHRDCVRWGNGATPALFALIQSLNQFLNQRSQFGGITFICHRNTKLAPVFLHAVSLIHLRCSVRMLANLRWRKHVWCHEVKWFCSLRFTTQCV